MPSVNARPSVDVGVETTRNSTLRDLRAVLSRENFDGVMRCAARLSNELPKKSSFQHNVVLVAYGGGKDSSYTLAFVRAMQLVLFQEHATTFELRVVTNRHAGMPAAVLENIDRAYRALRLYSDPSCELLLVDGNDVGPFRMDAPQRAAVIERNRLDILMTGHRTFADARPTFCNACNLSMVNAFGLAASYGDGVDAIVTGDSKQEQRDYAIWVRQLARRVTVSARGRSKPGFKGFLATANDISAEYFRDIHSIDQPGLVAERRVHKEAPERLQFFSIYEETAYSSKDHWRVLTEFLGFEFDDFAFSFTESDCGNPALMAHLRGLKSERLYGLDYADGLAEYVEFALMLMRQKEFPELLIDTMKQRYEGAERAAYMRSAASDYARVAYGLTEEQLVCMVYSPFADRGRGLDEYLRREQPWLHAMRIRAVLETADDNPSDRTLVARLKRTTGLTLPQLRVLYRSALCGPQESAKGTSLIDAILAGDPHKAVISTRHSPDGPVVLELLSGR